jgi:hypothetical protein
MRPKAARLRGEPEPACERSEPACAASRRGGRGFDGFERRAKETARRLIREPGGRVEPAGVEPVAANQARPNLSHYRQTAYL